MSESSNLEDVVVEDSEREIGPVKKASNISLPKMRASTGIDTSSDTLYSPMTIEGYEGTLKEWKKKAIKFAFVYDYVVTKYRKKLNSSSLTAFVLTSLCTLLSLGNFGLNDADYPTVSYAFKGIIATFTVSAAISTGISRVLGWNTLVESCQKYLDKVENLVASITSEQSLPMKYRTDPEQYILQHKDEFTAILNSAPDISHDDYVDILEAYEEAQVRLRQDIIGDC